MQINRLFNVSLTFFLTFILIHATDTFESTIQTHPPITIELTHGSNTYHSLSHYFHNFQSMTISDLTSSVDNRTYHFCFLGQETKSSIQLLQSFDVFNSSKNNNNSMNENEVLFDLDNVIKREKIVGSFFDRVNGVVLVVAGDEVVGVKMGEGGKIGISETRRVKLPNVTSRAKFIKGRISGSLYLMTQSDVFKVNYNPKDNTLDLIKYHKQAQDVTSEQNLRYLNIFEFSSDSNIESLGIVTPKSIKSFTIASKDPTIMLSTIQIFGFKDDIENAFYFQHTSSQPQSQPQTLFLISTQEHFHLFPTPNLHSNQTLIPQQLTRLPQTFKCTNAKQWSSYLFLECRNHLLYIGIGDLVRCSTQEGYESRNKCVEGLKFGHVNVGYRVQGVGFGIGSGRSGSTEPIKNDRLVIVGADRYEVRYIETQTNPQTQSHPTITSITPTTTYHPATFLTQVHLLTPNTSLIVTRNQFVTFSHIQQKNEVFCKTADQNTNNQLDQPSGDFSGVLEVKGFCGDLVRQRDTRREGKQDDMENEFCTIQVPLLVRIDPKVEKVESLWYISIIVFGLLAIGAVVYWIVKRNQLNSQHKLLQEEIQNGRYVQQKTTVTESNQDQITISQTF